MAQLTLRTPDDVRRLFSALGDVPLTHESGHLSVADVDQMALAGDLGDEVDMAVLGVSLIVAMASGWAAIKGYQRNQGSMGWGLTWAGLGFMFPLPAVAYTAYKS